MLDGKREAEHRELCSTMATLSLCSFLTVGLSHRQPTPTLCSSSSKTNLRFLSLAPSLFSSRAPALSFVTKFSETEPSILESQPQPETEPSQVIEPTPDSEPEREEAFAETEPSIPEVELSQVIEPATDLQPKREEVFAVVMIGSRQYIVFPGRFIYTQRLKDANANDKNHRLPLVAYVEAAVIHYCYLILATADWRELLMVTLNKVLLVGTKTHTYIGQPVVPNAVVQAVVEEQGKNKKVTVFKYKKKKGYRRNIGHRQPNTRIRITGITGYENALAATNL